MLQHSCSLLPLLFPALPHSHTPIHTSSILFLFFLQLFFASVISAALACFVHSSAESREVISLTTGLIGQNRDGVEDLRDRKESFLRRECVCVCVRQKIRRKISSSGNYLHHKTSGKRGPSVRCWLCKRCRPLYLICDLFLFFLLSFERAHLFSMQTRWLLFSCKCKKKMLCSWLL